ncbi:sororin [Leuresthes tenuis]|uniref:sororin n=1 Tax=Leuresthes tenuis TaxID=355514 RepID=UPI003B50368E
MNERTRNSTMTKSCQLHDPQRRRSPRLSSPQAPLKSNNKMALPSVAVKRSITVRKIAPRKTAAPSEHNKENTPRRSGDIQQKKTKVSTPDPVPDRKASSSSSSAKKKKKKKRQPALPSPILPSSPPASPCPQQPAADPEDAVWSQKVRRSYSRLSDKSINSPDSRDTLFGFEKLKTPEVGRRVEHPRTALEVSGSFSGLNSFTSLLEADDCGSALPEPDPNIPGVAVVKERRRRRRKVPQIGTTELEALAAKMNAEFEEADEFELVVE